jgi:ribose transport system substrate-binding protein
MLGVDVGAVLAMLGEDVMAGMTRTIAACAALTGLLALTAPPASAEGGKRVAFLDGPIADKYIGAMTRGFMDTAKAGGLQVTLVQSPFDPALQAQQLDDAIAQKVDLVALMIMSQKALIPALTRAKEAHIPVLLLNTTIDEKPLYTAFVGEPSEQMGMAAGKAMGDTLKSAGRVPAKVAVVAGSMDEGIAPLRVAGFKKAMEAYPGISIVAIEETHWAPPEAERAAGQLLARFAGQGGLDGIFGMNDALANGVVQGAESAGVKLGTAKGSLVVVGGNCMAPGMAGIDQGKIQATTSMLPKKMGEMAAQTAQDILAGKEFKKDVTLPIEIINKSNIEKYRADCTF